MTPTTAFLLYVTFAVGGTALYLLMPRPQGSLARAGAVLGLAALGLLLVLLITSIGDADQMWYFYLFGSIAIVAAARVVTHPKPVYSALYFVLVVVAVAALLVLREAEFAAVALIIVYAGAILVTYLFVIMLAQQAGSPVYDRRAREPFLAILAGFVLTAVIAGRAGDLPAPIAAPLIAVSTVESSEGGNALLTQSNTAAMGAAIMTKYVVALQIAGILLLISMVGAIAMSRKKVPLEGHAAPSKPLGQVGREVPPY